MNKGSFYWLADGFGAVAFALSFAALAQYGLSPSLSRASWIWAAALAGAVVFRGAVQLGAALSGSRAAARAKAKERAHILPLLLGTAPGRRVMLGETVADATDRVEDLDGYHARFLPLRHAAVMTPLVIAFAVAFASPISAGILLFTLVPFGVGMALTGVAAGRAARAQLDALSRLSGLFVDRVRSLPAIIGFGAQQRVERQLGVATTEVAERTVSVLRVAFLSGAVIEFFAALSVALVAVYCGFNLLRLLPFPVPERLTLGQSLFVLVLAPEFYLPMRRLAAAYHDKQIGMAARERLDALPPQPSPQLAEPLIQDASHPPALQFAHVVIDHGERRIGPFSFEAPAGMMTALVGPTGSGKSSLLHALLGLAPLAEGRILLDGQDIGSGGAILRGRVSWAGQSVALLPASLADNVRLARPSASEAEVAQAMSIAGLSALLTTRDGGVETTIDEHGSGLSGGERRRIGIARAMLRDAPLWLLDEPTADLDKAAAQIMLKELRAASRGRTVLLVTHDPALAALADQRVALV